MMRSPTLIGTFVLLFVIADGCTSVKRYKSATYKGEDQTLVDMSLFGTRLGDPDPALTGKSRGRVL